MWGRRWARSSGTLASHVSASCFKRRARPPLVTNLLILHASLASSCAHNSQQQRIYSIDMFQLDKHVVWRATHSGEEPRSQAGCCEPAEPAECPKPARGSSISYSQALAWSSTPLGSGVRLSAWRKRWALPISQLQMDIHRLKQ